MESYGQYCPISRSAEVLGDRWTILIIRDLMTGTTRFNELIRGNPGLSPHAAQPPAPPAAGRRHRRAAGRRHLRPHRRRTRPRARRVRPGHVGGPVDLRRAGGRGARPRPPAVVAHRQMDPTKLPEPRFTVYVPFTDHPKRYWIVVEQDPSLCLADPGFEVDVTLRADRASLYRTYLGQVSLADAQRSGHVAARRLAEGGARLRRRVPPVPGGLHRRRPDALSPPGRSALDTFAMLCTVAPMRNPHAGQPFDDARRRDRGRAGRRQHPDADALARPHVGRPGADPRRGCGRRACSSTRCRAT